MGETREEILLIIDASQAKTSGIDMMNRALDSLVLKLATADAMLAKLTGHTGGGIPGFDPAKAKLAASAITEVANATDGALKKTVEFQDAAGKTYKKTVTEFKRIGEEIKTIFEKGLGGDLKKTGTNKSTDEQKKALEGLRQEINKVGLAAQQNFNASDKSNEIKLQSALAAKYKDQAEGLKLIADNNQLLQGHESARLALLSKAEGMTTRQADAQNKLAKAQEAESSALANQMANGREAMRTGEKRIQVQNTQSVRDGENARRRAQEKRDLEDEKQQWAALAQEQDRVARSRKASALLDKRNTWRGAANQNGQDWSNFLAGGGSIDDAKTTFATRSTKAGNAVQQITQKAFVDDPATGLRNWQTLSVEVDKHGKVVKSSLKQSYSEIPQVTKKATDELKKFDDANRNIGRNMVANIKHVTTWAASVGVLYGSLGLARKGMSAMVDTGYQMARLQQVFRGTTDEVIRLTDGVIRLAAINGRARSEALESAVQWSRLGLNRVQVQEAVRVSLVAANVAELTAAESTEHLSSLMQVYGLRVQDLNSVLGMLNHTSNNFNVSNKALLEGLTRTSAIAKQAGLPLAELIGILGAGVGTTGQTGPNIGNAIKSIIGSLADTEKQKKLREMFRFEVKIEGGEDVKDFSGILGDLFVKYESLGRAERQSMLFTVAGKTQASRMAAILDSYVRGQVLAVKAQLDLNSAEKENALIIATLKAQFQGLITEFERFAGLQGQNGPGFVLGQTVTAARGFLGVMNQFPQTTTAILGIMSAMAMRIGVTAVAMDTVGKKGGVIVNTFQAIRNAVTGLAGPLNQAVLGFNVMGKRFPETGRKLDNWTRGGPAGGIGGFAPGAASQVSFQKTATGIKVIGEATALAAPKVMFFRGAVALLASTVASLGLWAATGVLVMMGWNKAMEYVGITSDKADKTLAKLTSDIRESESAANAAATAMKFLGTAKRALATTTEPSTRAEILRGIAQVTYPGIGGSDAEKNGELKQQADLQAQLDAAEKIANAKERQAALTQIIEKSEATLATRRQVKRSETFVESAIAAGNLRVEIEKLENSSFGSAENLSRFKEQLQSLESKQVERIAEAFEEQADALEKVRQHSQEFKIYMAQTKAIADGIAEVFDNMPSSGFFDKGGTEILKQQTLMAYHGSNLDALNAEEKKRTSAGIRPIDEVEARKMKIDSLLTGLGRQEAETGKLLDGWKPLDVIPDGHRRKQLEDQYLSIREEMDALAKERVSLADEQNTAESKGLTQIQARSKEERDLKHQAEQRLEAAKQLLEVQKTMDRRNIAGRIAGFEGDRFAFGENPGAAISNQRTGLEGSVNRNQMRGMTAFLTGNIADGENAMVTALQQSVQLEETRVKIIESAYDAQRKLHQELKDYQKTLLGAGPAELLRKLAVNQLSGKGFTSGQFFGMGEESRRDLLSRPEYGDTARTLRTLRERNPDLFDKDGNAKTTGVQKLAAEEAQRRNDMKSFLAKFGGGTNFNAVPQINQQFKEAGEAVNHLGKAANTAADALYRLAHYGSPTGGPPHNTQSPATQKTPGA